MYQPGFPTSWQYVDLLCWCSKNLSLWSIYFGAGILSKWKWKTCLKYTCTCACCNSGNCMLNTFCGLQLFILLLVFSALKMAMFSAHPILLQFEEVSWSARLALTDSLIEEKNNRSVLISVLLCFPQSCSLWVPPTSTFSLFHPSFSHSSSLSNHWYKVDTAKELSFLYRVQNSHTNKSAFLT